MKKRTLCNLLFVAISTALIQGCKKLERINPPCPKMTSLSPGAAKYNDIVTITGTDFIAGLPNLYKITIGDTVIPAANILEVESATTVRFKVPKGIGSGPLRIRLVSEPGCAGESLNFIYKYTVNSGNIINPFGGQTGNTSCEKCFKNPQGLDVDSNGDIFVADQLHYVIKKINAVTRDVTLIAGVTNTPDYLDNNLPLLAKFKNPMDVAVVGLGDVYVTDKSNFCIRKISGSGVSTLTGNATASGSVGGTLAVARFMDPTGLASDGANFLMVTEPNNRRLRLIDIAGNKVELLPPNNSTTLPFAFPYGVAYSDKRAGEFKVFVADAGNNSAIKGSSLLGNLTSINLPNSSIGQAYDLAFDNTGNLFVLDINRKQVVVFYADNIFEAIAGNGINGPSVFKSVAGMAIDRKNRIVYISDDIAHTIVQIKLE